MDAKQLAQEHFEAFNDRSFFQNAEDRFDANAVIIDGPSGQQYHGPEGYVRYAQQFVTAMPDIKGTLIEQHESGNKVTTRVHGQGTLTGTLHTPQGTVQGRGQKVDLEYQLVQECNDAGKIVRFTLNYDLPSFMKQVGMG
jgi:predicted ester cyclase